jgi:hypothetical protein
MGGSYAQDNFAKKIYWEVTNIEILTGENFELN